MQSNWVFIDAKNKILGRLSTQIAKIISGRNKVDFDSDYLIKGDNVILINAKEIIVTGDKFNKKLYRWHSGYSGGLKEKKFSEIFKNKPEEVIRKAVYGMLPKNKLRSKMIKKLYIYLDDKHDKQAQLNINKQNV